MKRRTFIQASGALLAGPSAIKEAKRHGNETCSDLHGDRRPYGIELPTARWSCCLRHHGRRSWLLEMPSDWPRWSEGFSIN